MAEGCVGCGSRKAESNAGQPAGGCDNVEFDQLSWIAEALAGTVTFCRPAAALASTVATDSIDHNRGDDMRE